MWVVYDETDSAIQYAFVNKYNITINDHTCGRPVFPAMKNSPTINK